MAGRKTVQHPSVYEINTRVLLREFGGADRRARLVDIPEEFWIKIARRGIQWVWLMGVWRIVEKDYDDKLIPKTMMREFKELIPDLADDDIDGSPYAIDAYEVDPRIGDDDQLAEVRRQLNSLGMGLMLDFIPNHYGAHTHWIESNADYFIHTDASTAKAHQSTFYKSKRGEGQYFAHGKDPYFAAWQDTIQVNYANPATRAWMADRLKSVAKRCDGVRCDMAMLTIRKVFNQTWGAFTNWRDEQEFWPRAIRKAKEKYPGFTLLAECYWNMEEALLKMGFDYCYDKTFYDRLTDPAALQQHFTADPAYLMRTARFLENHDEERAASRLHLQQHETAAAMVAFSPGVRLWHQGQWRGRRKRTPVQLNRFAQEEPCQCLIFPDKGKSRKCRCIQRIYRTLTRLSSQPIFRKGKWENILIGGEQPLLWQWQHKSKKALIAINYSDKAVQITQDALGAAGITLRKTYFPAGADITNAHIALQPWSFQIWKLK